MARLLCVVDQIRFMMADDIFEFKFVAFSPDWNYGDLSDISLSLEDYLQLNSGEYIKFIQAADMQCHA